MTDGTTFLVERYIPRLGRSDLELLARRLAAASAELRSEGRLVYWLRSHALPNDETCLCFFVAHRRADVEEANRRAGSAFERILETSTIEGNPPRPR
jgi:Nickel responsive protein SCO4226-like